MVTRRFSIVITAFLSVALAPVVLAEKSEPPSEEAVDSAFGVTDQLVNMMVAAIIDLTLDTDADNAEEGSKALKLLLDDRNVDVRLVGELEPLSENSLPLDEFEVNALSRAQIGEFTVNVERVKGNWYYRLSAPLTNAAYQCAFCHTNYDALPPEEYVGALMTRVPIND